VTATITIRRILMFSSGLLPKFVIADPSGHRPHHDTKVIATPHRNFVFAATGLSWHCGMDHVY